MTNKCESKQKIELILASSSKSRIKLLEQAGVVVDKIIASGIDESVLKGEKARALALRLACQKAEFVASCIMHDAIILAADTVPVARGIILHKAETDDDVRRNIKLLSNRRHHIYTAICVIEKRGSEAIRRSKVVKSIVKMKHISDREVEYFVALGDGIGKAGGYSLQGYAESFVQYLSGSFSNIIGLPIYETVTMLESAGYAPLYKQNHK